MNDLELAIAAAQAGGVVVKHYFGGSIRVDLKSTNNPVTAADCDAESAIIDLIRAHRPEDSIIAEESGGSPGSARRWLIDPLDGTVNFVHRISHLAVSVALYEGETAVVATVVDPLRGETFTAQADKGTRLNGHLVEASSASELRDTVIATGFAYDHDRYADEYTRPVAAVLARANGIRRFGSAALDLAWVAAGRFDGYWELGVAPWDIAAGILLVREAGGIVTDPFGQTAIPETALIIAAGSGIHGELRSTVHSALPKRLRESE